MSEKILQFGQDKSLIGIASIPTEASYLNRPAILILNSGLVHRVGPFRLGVDIARQFSNSGSLVFRFDLPGIGDSTQYQSDKTYEERVSKDIGSAMDIISSKYNINEFVSLGLCTGAMNSHIITTQDERVVGAILIDAYAYPTLKYLYFRYRKKILKLLNPQAILRAVNSINNSKTQGVTINEGIDYFSFPSKKTIQNDLKNIICENKKMLYIYTGGMEYLYNYRNQLQDSFNSIKTNSNIDVFYFKKMDHTFILHRDREKLKNTISEWFSENYC